MLAVLTCALPGTSLRAQSFEPLAAGDFATYGAELISEYLEIRGDFKAESAVGPSTPAAIVDRQGRHLVRLELARTPADTLRWLERNGCRNACRGLTFRGQVVVSATTRRPALMLLAVSRPAAAAPAAIPPAPVAATPAQQAPVAPSPASAPITHDPQRFRLPLEYGFYIDVEQGRECANASNATLLLIGPRNFNVSQVGCSHTGIEQHGDRTFVLDMECDPIQGDRSYQNRETMRIDSRTRFTLIDAETDNPRSTFQHCPQPQLPEPWRDNDIDDITR